MCRKTVCMTKVAANLIGSPIIYYASLILIIRLFWLLPFIGKWTHVFKSANMIIRSLTLTFALLSPKYLGSLYPIWLLVIRCSQISYREIVRWNSHSTLNLDAHCQFCYRGACKISERLENSKHRPRGSNGLGGFTVRCRMQHWDASGKSNITSLSMDYRKVSNIRRTKSQNLNASRLIL